MTNLSLSILKAVIHRYPEIVPHLTGKARWIVYTRVFKMQVNILGGAFDLSYKTADYFQQQLERLIRSVYGGNLGGEFIDVMANLISGQLTQAFEQAWKDEGTEDAMPDYLTSAAEDLILGQYDYVDQLYRDIVDARVDETGVDALLARAPLWANRWNEAYNQAVGLIMAETGGRLKWVLGETEQHCASCAALNGIVALASEWEALGVRPQSAPNGKLECGGWQCDCSLEATDQRRSPGAYGRIEEAVL